MEEFDATETPRWDTPNHKGGFYTHPAKTNPVDLVKYSMLPPAIHNTPPSYHSQLIEMRHGSSLTSHVAVYGGWLTKYLFVGNRYSKAKTIAGNSGNFCYPFWTAYVAKTAHDYDFEYLPTEARLALLDPSVKLVIHYGTPWEWATCVASLSTRDGMLTLFSYVDFEAM